MQRKPRQLTSVVNKKIKTKSGMQLPEEEGQEDVHDDDEEEEEVEFDDFPKSDAVDEVKWNHKPVRASFVPGLLSIREVDLILRGQFRPPYDASDAKSDVMGGCFSNITPTGSKKVSENCSIFQIKF
jgi:hypothetical protein